MGGKAGKVHTWNKDRLKGQLEIQSMVWPGLIFLFIFSYIPMYGIIIAFKDFNIMSGFAGGEFVGLKYFRQFLPDAVRPHPPAMPSVPPVPRPLPCRYRAVHFR